VSEGNIYSIWEKTNKQKRYFLADEACISGKVMFLLKTTPLDFNLPLEIRHIRKYVCLLHLYMTSGWVQLQPMQYADRQASVMWCGVV